MVIAPYHPLGYTEELSFSESQVDMFVLGMRVRRLEGVLIMSSLSPTGPVQLVQVLLPDENHRDHRRVCGDC
jgi:hypothetical protein